MQAKIENNELVIRIPLDQPKLSSSGKALIVAGTGRSVKTVVEIDDKPVFAGRKAHIKR